MHKPQLIFAKHFHGDESPDRWWVEDENLAFCQSAKFTFRQKCSLSPLLASYSRKISNDDLAKKNSGVDHLYYSATSVMEEENFDQRSSSAAASSAEDDSMASSTETTHFSSDDEHDLHEIIHNGKNNDMSGDLESGSDEDDQEKDGEDEDDDDDDEDDKEGDADDDEDDDDTSILISNTNKLLNAVGIAAKTIVSKDELSRVAPSMFVAVYESLYHTRIDGIVRSPESRMDYEQNAQLVIDHLSDQINIDLTHISGKAIVAGEYKALSDLIHIFMRIISLTSEASISTIESSALDDSVDDYSGFGGDKYNFLPRSKDSGMKYKTNNNMMSYHHRPASSKAVLQNSTKIPKLISETFARAEKKLRAEIKQNNASKRRNRIISNKETISKKANLLKTRRTAKALLAKYEDAKLLEQKAFESRLINQEKILLEKLYRSIFKEAITSKVDKHRQMKQKENEMLKSVEQQIAMLEQTFKDKLILVENYYSKVKDMDRASEEGKVQSFMEEIVRQLQKEENLLNQQRDKAIMRRKQMLLSHTNHRELKKGDWEEYLRSYPNA